MRRDPVICNTELAQRLPFCANTSQTSGPPYQEDSKQKEQGVEWMREEQCLAIAA